MYKFVCRTWREAGYPIQGVPIPEPRLTRLLHVSARSVRQYKFDLEPYIVVQHGGRSHPRRYRPAVSKADIARLQATAAGSV